MVLRSIDRFYSLHGSVIRNMKPNFVGFFFGFFYFVSGEVVVSSNEQLLDGELELLNLVLQLTAFVSGDASGNHGPGHAAGAAKSCLRGNEHIGDVLQ